MTSISFRTEAALATELDALAATTGTTRSALLNRALKDLLYRMACEQDAEIYDRTPLTDAELLEADAQVWTEPTNASW